MFDMVTPPFGCITVNQIQNRSPAPPKAKRIQCPLFTILGCCWDCCPFIYQHLENPRLALQSGPTISAGKDLRSAYRPIARASLVAQWFKKKKKNLPAMQENLWFNPWVRKIPWRRKWQPTPVLLLGEPHGQKSLVELQSMGSQRVRHKWRDHLSTEIQGEKPLEVQTECSMAK